MKIAIIGHKRIPSNEGGIEKGVEQHAVRMVQRGNDVTVYNRGGHNVFGKEFDGKKLKKYKGINIVTVPTVKGAACNGVQREHNKKLNNGLPILHKVPPKRDYGRYFCIMAEKGGTSHGGLTEKLSPFFHAKKQEVNAYGR